MGSSPNCAQREEGEACGRAASGAARAPGVQRGAAAGGGHRVWGLYTVAELRIQEEMHERTGIDQHSPLSHGQAALLMSADQARQHSAASQAVEPTRLALERKMCAMMDGHGSGEHFCGLVPSQS